MNSDFRRSINGLRGIAILMVLLYHWSHIRGGFTGVDVFFVISGYLISSHIARDLSSGTFSFMSFYAKRARRIFPSLVTVLLFALALGWFRSFDDQFRLLGKHVQSGALFLNNFRLYSESGYFDSASETKPLLHLWSLAIEEQFYLLWPVLFWVTYRLWKGARSLAWVVLAATLLSFTANLYLSPRHPEMAFYLLPTRLWELAFGYLVFLSRSRLRSLYDSPMVQLAGLALIIFGCASIRGQVGFPGMKALIPVLGAGILLGGTEKGLVNRTLLSSKLLGFFGTISYVLYLWHWPLYSFMKSLILTNVDVALALITLALSWLTHRFVEKPFMNFQVTQKNRIRMVLVGAASLGAIAFAGTLVGDGAVHGQMVTFSLPAAKDVRSGKVCTINGGLQTFSPDALKPCDLLPYPNAPLVLLVGDSHAISLNDGVDELATSKHFNLVTWTSIYCTPLSVHDSRPACRDFNHYVLDWIAHRKPDLVLVDANHLLWHDDANYGEAVPYPAFVTSRLNEIRRLIGKEVLLVGQNPGWEISLPRVLNIAFLARGIPIPERTYQGIDQSSLKWDQVMKHEAELSKIPYFSIRDEICKDDGCRVKIGDRLETDLMDYDYGHLSRKGSLYVVQNGLGTMILSLVRRPRSLSSTRSRSRRISG